MRESIFLPWVMFLRLMGQDARYFRILSQVPTGKEMGGRIAGIGTMALCFRKNFLHFMLQKES